MDQKWRTDGVTVELIEVSNENLRSNPSHNFALRVVAVTLYIHGATSIFHVVVPVSIPSAPHGWNEGKERERAEENLST